MRTGAGDAIACGLNAQDSGWLGLTPSFRYQEKTLAAYLVLNQNRSYIHPARKLAMAGCHERLRVLPGMLGTALITRVSRASLRATV